MALLPIHKYFCLNGEIRSVKEFVSSENEGGVYEVLRVVDNIPLFLDEHLSRFYHSAELAQKDIRFSSKQIFFMLHDLIDANQIKEGNILISCKTNLKAFFIPHVYPTEEQYTQGVKCGILHAERENPNAKVFQTNVRHQANRLIAEEGFYEVFLVDQEGRITEGSRSNVFFVKGNELLTPMAQRVLLGITRMKTFECAASLGFSLSEHSVFINDLSQYDAVFITGTSPKLLPVKEVNNVTFDCNNSTLRRVMEEFDKLIFEYIKTPGLF